MSTEKRRIHTLDELRGLMILIMVVHHTFYTLGFMYGVTWAREAFFSFGVLQPIGAALFVLICGFCCTLSNNNLRRGLLLAGVAVAMSLFLYFFMPQAMISFGVLHCLAACILLYTATAKLLPHIPLWLGVAVCALLALLTWHLPAGEEGLSPGGGWFGIRGLFQIAVPASWQAQWWLFPLGIGSGKSADYFPLMPWAFIFFAGALLGRLAPNTLRIRITTLCPPCCANGASRRSDLSDGTRCGSILRTNRSSTDCAPFGFRRFSVEFVKTL